MRGFVHHLLLSLKLNFRNPQAIVFGYVVPVFFLFAFAAFYVRGRDGGQQMAKCMGQLLTITILGGACFGMPVTFVSERERGLWRRLRLTPMPTVWFVVSVLLGRFVLVASAGVIQIALGVWVYNMPLPRDPGRLVLALSLASFAFLGIGLVISMIASSTQAVQALGQSLFLPVIIIGGVGVELARLPNWTQHVAAFLPGRYAVQAIDPAFLSFAGAKNRIPDLFNDAALLVIGLAGLLAATKLFRWENNQKHRWNDLAWAGLAVVAWAAVGVLAEVWGFVVVK